MERIRGSGNVLVLGGGYSVICLPYYLTCTFMFQCTFVFILIFYNLKCELRWRGEGELSAKQMCIGEAALRTPSLLPLIQLPFPRTVPLLRTPRWQNSTIL